MTRADPDEAETTARRSPAALFRLGVAAAAAFLVLVTLGTWQLERRAWKLDLIARVEARVHAPPVPAPGPAEWPAINAPEYEYRHVALTGVFLHDRETTVVASTRLGPGAWVLTPLRRDDGTLVLVNRGFVPDERRDPASRPGGQGAGETTVTGLLRITEPGGMWLRANDPATGRWFSRDVAAIAAARGLGPVAPYFVDADAGPGDADAPVGGLTVVSFPNNHLLYAATWYGLALMLAGWVVHAVRYGNRP